MESCQYTAGEREKTETIGELYMASIYMDSEGHLADVAVVPMGLLTYYLNQYPTASNQIAATMLTGLPERALSHLMDAAQHRLAAEGQTVADLVAQQTPRYERMIQLIKNDSFVRHPLLDRLLPVTELVIGYGCLIHDHLPKYSSTRGLTQGLCNRLRMDQKQLDSQWQMLRAQGVDLDDNQLFLRCVAEDHQRYQDIYNDMRVGTYIPSMDQKAFLADMEVLCISQIMGLPTLTSDDKSYILGAHQLSNLGLLHDLERQAEDRPLLRGLSADERDRLVGANRAELEKVIERAKDFPTGRVYHLREAFIERDPMKRIVEPYQRQHEAFLQQRANRVWVLSWDLIQSEQPLSVLQSVTEAVAQLALRLGTNVQVPAKDLLDKTVGEAQFLWLSQLMGDRGLKVLFEQDRLGFTSALNGGSCPELRNWVDKSMADHRLPNRMSAMELFLDKELVSSKVTADQYTRLTTVLRRYLKGRGVELDIPDEQVNVLLQKGLECQRRSKMGVR